jgi:hypothetical protein
MAAEVKLKPGWLTRDVGRASRRAKEWESAAQDKARAHSGRDNSATSRTDDLKGENVPKDLKR